jgi:hypothetical protein
LARGSLPLAALQHGDGVSAPYARGLPAPRSALLASLSSPASSSAAAAARTRVVVCHSEPGAWELGPGARARYWSGPRECPDAAAAARVGRTMFESDRLPDGWAARLNALDADGHREIIVTSGVHSIRYPINVELSNEDDYEAAAKALAAQVFPGSRLVRQRRGGWGIGRRSYLFEA